MTLSITQKLTLSFLGVTTVVLVATLGLARWSFHRGFLDYVNALEQVRLERLSTEVADLYTASGNDWERVRASFNAMQRRSLPAPPGRPPPHLMSGPEGRQPPGAPPSGLTRPDGPGAGPSTGLFDIKGLRIAGQSSADEQSTRVPVVANGTPIGELRSAPRRQLDSPLETRFAGQQLLASVAIGVMALALAGVVSLLLARALLSPVRRMIAGVSALSGGDYSVRLQAGRSDELGRLIGDLNRLAGILEDIQSSRKRWLADISHELRTPVTIMAGELDAIHDGVRHLDQEQLDSFSQEVGRLRNLIDDLYQLAVSDLGALRYRFKAMDLAAWIVAAVKSFRPRAESRGLEVTCNAPEAAWIDGDQDRLSQLIANLADNALAYTDAPGRINIELSYAPDEVSLTLEDSAPGIATGEQPDRLFEPLYRREGARSRRDGGAGLGLAICRNIVQAHRGSIDAAPSALGGIAFVITLPKRDTPST